MVRRRQFLRIYSLKFWNIWQNFYFYLILNNKSFIIEVEQTNFVIHLIITVQLYYWLSENLSVNKFQVLIINYYSKLCARLYENLMRKFHVKPRKSEVLRLYSIIHIAMETMKMSNFTCQSKSVISIFFSTCQVSVCEPQPFSCHDLANDIYPQTAKTVFSHLNRNFEEWMCSYTCALC